MKKFAIVGVYGEGENFTTGQAVKCYELIKWLNNKYSNNNCVVNTYNWKKNPIKLFFSLIFAFKKCEQIIILPAQHGLKVFAPLCYYLKKIFHRKIQYIVIGGWLADILKKNERLKRYISNFDGIFVETKTMVDHLKKIGITKCYYMPNSRKIPVEVHHTSFMKDNILRVCTYSRVTKDKGILDAINIVSNANKKLIKKGITITLDIYGKIEKSFQDEFQSELLNNKNFVKYCGIKNADEGVATLTKYDVLLFPTYYDGEGFAGTLLDSFASGTPVIANDWKYNREIIDDGINGLIYPYRNIDIASKKLIELIDSNKYNFIAKNCINESKKYTPDVVFGKFIKIVENNKK